MAGVSYEDMPLPKRWFRPDRYIRNPDRPVRFETLSDSLKEDAKRARLIGRSIEQHPNLFGPEAADLMRRLEEGVETHVPPPIMASHLFMRGVRIRVIGNAWPVVEDRSLAPAVVATLRPTGMWVPADELVNTNPHLLMRRLEALLIRLKFPAKKGYLLAGLHSEFDVNRGGYDFHYHLVAGGEMALAIDSLRKVRRFKAGRVEPHELLLPESARVTVSREPLTNLPDPPTYVLQSSHPHRPTTRQPDGTLARSKGRYRIPEPQHTQWLEWMNRWSVSDFMFCTGMKPTNSGFVLTSSK